MGLFDVKGKKKAADSYESTANHNESFPRHHLPSAALTHEFLCDRKHLHGDIAAQILLFLPVRINAES